MTVPHRDIQEYRINDKNIPGSLANQENARNAIQRGEKTTVATEVARRRLLGITVTDDDIKLIRDTLRMTKPTNPAPKDPTQTW